MPRPIGLMNAKKILNKHYDKRTEEEKRELRLKLFGMG